MAPVSNFFVVTDSSQLPSDIDPNCLVNIDRTDAEKLHHSSGVYIGGGIILTASHVPYPTENLLGGALKPGSLFSFNFGSGLSDVPDLAMQISGDLATNRFISGRDRFHDFAVPNTGADIASIDLARGGPISAGNAAFLRAIHGPSMVIFSNPNDAIGVNISMMGYPGITKDGQTLCQANGRITGHVVELLSLSGETLLAYSASLANEGGFSGGPVFATLDPDGDGVSRSFLLALDSATFGNGESFVAPLSDIYSSLAHSLEQFHSADEFARNLLIGNTAAAGSIYGQFFNEDIYAGGYDDRIDAAGGSDLVQASNGNDVVFGGAGNDTVFGGQGADTVFDGTGADKIYGGDGDDYIAANGLGSNDIFIGGNGIDFVSYANLTDNVTIDLVKQTATGVLVGSDRLSGIENGQGSNGNDVIFGNALDNVVDGRRGDDLLYGGDGKDQLVGLAGNDTMYGGLGRDMLRYDYDDGVNGGTKGIRANIGTGVVRDTSGNTDTIREIEDISGSVFNDILIGSSDPGDFGQNDLSGQDGNDTLDGRYGIDFLSGDGFRGGLWSDTFVFSTRLSATNNYDYIRDFQHQIDHISLSSAIFGALGAAVDSSELRLGKVSVDANDFLIYDKSTGKLYYDANGQVSGGQTLFAILTSGTELTAADFMIA